MTASFGAEDPAYLIPDPQAFYATRTVTDQGTISVSSSQASTTLAALQAVFGGSFGWSLNVTIAQTGSLLVDAAGAGAVAYGYVGANGVNGTLKNDGFYSVSATQTAVGASLGTTDQLNNTGVFNVSAQSAIGIKSNTSFGRQQSDTNSGAITVSGVTLATGFEVAGANISLFNSGSITAIASSGISVGVDIVGNVASSGFNAVLNYGTITAQVAVRSVTVGSESVPVTVNNSGVINGLIDFGAGVAGVASQVFNSGAINGDVYLSLAGNDRFDGRAGTLNGTLHLGGGTSFVLLGNDGETVHGGAGSATILGGAGADTIIGGDGSDTITSGGGNDTLTGGLGADTFVISAAAGAVAITDFSGQQGDRIDLSSVSGFYFLPDVQAAAIQSGADTVINLGGGQTLTLDNVLLSSLTAAQFVFGSILVGSGVVTLSAGDAVTLTGYQFATFTAPSGGTLINNGSISLTSSGPFAAIALDASNTTALFRNYGAVTAQGVVGAFGGVQLENYGSISITTLSIATGPTALLINGGSISVTATPNHPGDDTIAYGASPGATGLLQNLAAGTLTVSVPYGSATGVRMALGGEFDNAGVVTVAGGSAIGWSSPLGTGVQLEGADHGLNAAYAVINNSGSINATGTDAVGIQVGRLAQGYPHSSPGAGQYNLINSGTITAATAIHFLAGSGFALGTVAAIDNSGVINGAVLLSEQDDRLVNTGTINGVVDLGTGNDILDSHAGTITGAVTIGTGSSTVSLGAENNLVVIAGGGNHLVDGGGGNNTISYINSGAAVNVTLASQGQAQNTSVSIDTLTHFQNVVGSAHSDNLAGDSGDNILDGGGGGNDVLDGAGGVNTASFASAGKGVAVSLALQGQAQNTGVGLDTLSNFQNLTGSSFRDRLTDDAHDNVLTGGAGADVFILGGGGNDTIADFAHAQGDKIDLSAFSRFASFADILASATQVGADTVINTGSGSLTLKNVAMSSLTAGDFQPGLHINVSYDPSVASAPAGFTAAVDAAVQFFETTFSNDITINIAVGWGEVQGQVLGAGELGASIDNYDTLDFQTVKTELAAADASFAAAAAGIANLGEGPGGNPNFEVATAEEKAWGLSPSAAVDGYVGLSSAAPLTFDPGNRAVVGSYDAIGVLEHEISEVMGRVANAGLPFFDGGPNYAPLDLFRYGAPGVHSYLQGFAYFSPDGSELLKAFNDGSYGGDDGDWARLGTADAFDAFGRPGVIEAIAPVDVSVIQALGYNTMTPPADPGPVGPALPPESLTQVNSDFGNQGQDALLFRNAATGDWGYMSTNPGGGETWHPIGSSSSDYAPLGRGDFNGDGVLDTAFRQTSTGNWGFLTINPSGGESWHQAGSASLAYDAVATGDILGAGSADIVFRNAASGDWGFMSTNGSSQVWHPIGASSASYSVVGYGDFNGDGVFDVAFRNGQTGDWGFMSVPSTGGEVWHPVGSASTAYAAVASADFLGAGQTEIMFRNPTTGDWGFMQANNSGGETWRPIGPTGPGYAVIGNGDFNGDGVQDVAFRNTSTGDWGFMTVLPTGGEVWHGVGSASLAYGTI